MIWALWMSSALRNGWSMDEGGIIDVERDFADERERVRAILVIENAHVLGDQPSKRIEGEPADGSFDPAPVQFFHDAQAPLPAESLSGKIVTTAEKCREAKDEREPKDGNGQAAGKGWLPIFDVAVRVSGCSRTGIRSLLRGGWRISTVAALYERRILFTDNGATVMDRRYSNGCEDIRSAGDQRIAQFYQHRFHRDGLVLDPAQFLAATRGLHGRCHCFFDLFPGRLHGLSCPCRRKIVRIHGLDGRHLFSASGFARSARLCHPAPGDPDAGPGFSTPLGPASADGALDHADLALCFGYRGVCLFDAL